MYLPKSRIFLLLSLAVTAGLGFGYRVQPLALAGLGMFFIMSVTLGWDRRAAWALGLVGVGFVASAQWSGMRVPADLTARYGQKLPMAVIIDDDPALKDKSITFPARLVSLDGRSLDSKVIVVLMRYPVYEYGMRLEMEGKLEAVTEFNYKDNASGQVVFPEVSAAEPGHGAAWRGALYRLKHSLLAKLGTILPEPHAGLMGGLLLGTRDMPKELLEQFRVTGTSHIVAVSGFNVTIVAGFLDALLRRFGRSASFYGSILAIFGFVIITGASASVVRAGIMGGMVLMAQQAGRMYASVNALVFSAALMLLDNPRLLEFDIGFQLSFGALAGLLFVHPKLEGWLPWKNWATAAIYPTIAAQISTAPLILYHFGNFSVISVLTNFLVLPAIPLAMLAGFISLVVGYVLPPVAVFTAMPAWLVLEYVIRAVGLTAQVPGAAVDGLPFPLWAMFLYYLALVTALRWKSKPKT